MRLFASVSSLLVLGLLACSGASSSGEPTEDPAPTLPSRDPSLDPGTPPPAPAPPPAAPALPAGDGGASEGGGGDGGGGGGGTGGGTGGGAGSLCVAGSVAEAEPNGTAETANTIPSATGSFCGSLAAAGDVDFFTFVLPADAKYLGFASAFSQQGVGFQLTVAGQSFGAGEAVIFKPGQTYVVKASTNGKAPVSYRFGIEIKK